MADVSVKMGVSGIGQFRSEISQAQSAVKTFDSALKLADRQFKATGDSQKYMQDKTAALQGKLAAQQSAVRSAEAALKSMAQSGVDPASQAFQRMQQTLLNAQSSVLDTQNDINSLGAESADAAGKTDQLASSLGGLNKKISLDQVISGIDKITGGMEKAAKKAVDLGKAIWDNITDNAGFADDIATQAMMMNMDVETFQRYKKVFDTIGELTVQEWQKARTKVEKAIYNPSTEQTRILDLLGINTYTNKAGADGIVRKAAKSYEDVFWDIGETLKAKVESGEMTQDLADTYANALFGKSWAELNPMFALGKDAFEKALAEQDVASEEAVNKMATLNDKLIELQGDFQSLQVEVLSGLAPALTGAAEALDGLLGKLLDYLKTDEGKKALEDMGKAVEGLFSDLSEIEPQKVVEGFAGVFDQIVTGVQWISNNKDTVISAMTAIVAGWAGLKLTGGILQIVNLINGLSGLTAGGAVGSAAQAGAAVGSSWAGGFARAVKAAAPWLVGLYTLGKNAITPQGNDDLYVDDAGNTHWAETGEVLYDRDGKLAQGPVTWEVPSKKTDTWSGESITEDQIEAAQKFWDFFRESAGKDIDDAAWDSAFSDYEGAFEGAEELFEKIDAAMDKFKDGVDTGDPSLWPEDLPEDFFTVFVTPELEDGAQEKLQGAVAGMDLNAVVRITPMMGRFGGLHYYTHANGIPWIPFDGYPALLHRGERVLTASANQSYTYNSNTYFGNVNLNNGMEVEALSESIARQNRKVQRGFGS